MQIVRHMLACVTMLVLVGANASTAAPTPDDEPKRMPGWLATVRLADGQVVEQQVVVNPYTAVPKAKGIRVAEWLVEQKTDVLLVREDMHGKGPLYVLAEAGVEVVQTSARTVAEAIHRLSHLEPAADAPV